MFNSKLYLIPLVNTDVMIGSKKSQSKNLTVTYFYWDLCINVRIGAEKNPIEKESDPQILNRFKPEKEFSGLKFKEFQSKFS